MRPAAIQIMNDCAGCSPSRPGRVAAARSGPVSMSTADRRGNPVRPAFARPAAASLRRRRRREGGPGRLLLRRGRRREGRFGGLRRRRVGECIARSCRRRSPRRSPRRGSRMTRLRLASGPRRRRNGLQHHLHRVGHQRGRRRAFPERMIRRVAGGDLNGLWNESGLGNRDRLRLRGHRDGARRKAGLPLRGARLGARRVGFKPQRLHLRICRLRRHPIRQGRRHPIRHSRATGK